MALSKWQNINSVTTSPSSVLDDTVDVDDFSFSTGAVTVKASNIPTREDLKNHIMELFDIVKRLNSSRVNDLRDLLVLSRPAAKFRPTQEAVDDFFSGSLENSQARRLFDSAAKALPRDWADEVVNWIWQEAQRHTAAAPPAETPAPPSPAEAPSPLVAVGTAVATAASPAIPAIPETVAGTPAAGLGGWPAQNDDVNHGSPSSTTGTSLSSVTVGSQQHTLQYSSATSESSFLYGGGVLERDDTRGAGTGEH